jgi:hypothetical protein
MPREKRFLRIEFHWTALENVAARLAKLKRKVFLARSVHDLWVEIYYTKEER